MLEEESKAMDIVNALLANEQIPMKRIKSLQLNWEIVGSAYLPVLYCEFYNDEKTPVKVRTGCVGL